jgi:uncharacterized RDD family membrane protein YckC
MNSVTKTKTIAITDAMLATRGQRFANYLIDLIIHNFINLIPLIVGWLLYEFFGNDELSVWLDELNPVVDFLISYVIIVIYFMIMESLTGRSIGKYATNTKVLMADGSEPEPYAIFIRSISRLIPFEAFSFLGDIPKGWHDTISKTVVVDINKYNLENEMANSINEIGQEV